MTSTDGHARLDSTATMSDTATLAPTPQPSAFTKPTTLDGTAIPETTPPDHPFRTLVLCFDGTGDQFDADNSNIVQFFSMLKKDDPSKQLVYYQAGIGTYTTPQIATPLATKFSQSMDMAIAWNLDSHIMGGYEFLMQNYKAKDRICIFGFSRGAYTARCLAGMIHKVGLLPAYNNQQVPFAYKMYTTTDDVGWKQSNAFKKTFSVSVDIEFLGVWDTVNSVGLIPRRLPFTTSNTVVRTFRHAVSLDERRAKFKANLWNRPTPTEETLSVTDKQIAKVANKQPDSKKKTSTLGKKPGSSMKDLEAKFDKDKTAPTDIDEVWFAGCHCDVGGGSVGNGIKPSLAGIPFRWMLRECFKTNSGILFHTEGLKKAGLDPAALYPIVLPRPPALNSGVAYIEPVPKVQPPPIDDDDEVVVSEVHASEEDLDLKDALAPIYDQLNLSWWWWLLEFLPIKHRYQEGDNSWATYFGWNLGRGRHIPKQRSRGVRVHRSVKTRLDAEYANGQKYKPKSNLNLDCVTWVD